MRATRIRLSLLAVLLAGLLALSASLGTTAAPVIEEDPETRADLLNLGLAYHLVDAVFNDGDADAARQLFADDAVISTQVGEFTGAAGALEYVALVQETYPDSAFEITSISSGGDTVVIEWALHATEVGMDTYGRTTWTPLHITGVATLVVVDSEITQLSPGSEALALQQRSSEAASGPSSVLPGAHAF